MMDAKTSPRYVEYEYLINDEEPIKTTDILLPVALLM